MTPKYSQPVASWFTGHLHVMQPAKLAFMERCEQEFPLGRFRLYHVPLFVVSDPELVGEVLVRRNDDFVKTWVLRGDGDPNIPVRYAEDQKRFFAAEVHVIEGAGHWPMIDEPERTRALVLPFLRRAVHSPLAGHPYNERTS